MRTEIEIRRRPRTWRQARVTMILIVVNVLWFLLVESSHGYSVDGLVQSGALYTPDVWNGQWYRVVSAMFVHVNTTHLLVNMVSLYSMHTVELMIGSRRYLLTYFLSGFMGFLFSLFLVSPNVVSAGASGSIFGVFGVALFMALKGILSKAARNQMLAILVLNLVYDVVNPHVGLIGHLAGLITGMVCSALFVSRYGERKNKSKLDSVLAGASAIVILLSLGLSLFNL